MLKIRRALLSVSNKEGIVELASELHRLGVEIISTGGTHALLSASKIPVKQVSEITGFPEILDGRVKTLHPAVHAGLLAVLDNPVHRKQLDDLHIQPIDLVVVNLYPFKETIMKSGATTEDAIEQIDIGGPAMIRSAAKNYRFTCVVVSPKKYPGLVAELRERNGFGQRRDMLRAREGSLSAYGALRCGDCRIPPAQNDGTTEFSRNVYSLALENLRPPLWREPSPTGSVVRRF